MPCSQLSARLLKDDHTHAALAKFQERPCISVQSVLVLTVLNVKVQRGRDICCMLLHEAMVACSAALLHEEHQGAQRHVEAGAEEGAHQC